MTALDNKKNKIKYLRQMRISIIATLIITSLSSHIAEAQNKERVFGYVSDAVTGERLPSATVFAKRTNVAVSTNGYGYYSLSNVQQGDTICVIYLGYKDGTVIVGNEERQDIMLVSKDHSIEEVTVKAESFFKQEVVAPKMSHHHLTTKDFSRSFSLFGSSDALKTLQLMPGVNSAADGGTNLSVRGGSFDQNMILLDEATIYNPAHSMGIFSAINTDAVSSVDFYKGAAPAKYGGRLSSVVDMRMKEGNNQEFHVDGSLGLVESRLLAEGPIAKGKSSFMFSGRMGYGLASKEVVSQFDEEGFSRKNDLMRFFDFCAKANWNVNDRDKLYASAYLSSDRFKCAILMQDNNQQWGNNTATLRWNHIYSNSCFANFSVVYSKYNYLQRQEEDSRKFDWKSGMLQLSAKYDIDKYTSNNHHIIYGAKAEYHHYNPGEIAPWGESVMVPVKLKSKDLVLVGGYLGDEFHLGDKIGINAGIHVDMSTKLGGEGATYVTYEPRAALSYALNDYISLKGSYAHTAQYQHLLNNSALGLPTDIWTPSDSKVKPQQADAVSAGIHGYIPEGYTLGGLEYSMEGYYKWMHDIIDFKDGTDFTMNENIEDDLLSGSGRAKGLEFMLAKEGKRYNAQISYTLSSAKRKIDGVNKGNWYYAVYDQKHNLIINGQYDINKRWSTSANFQYHTGGRTTLPYAAFYAYGTLLKVFTERNGYVMPDYHRLDMSIRCNLGMQKKVKQQLIFSVYNVYGRKNAYSMFVRQSTSYTRLQGYMMYLYRTVPSLTWRIKF